MRPALKTLFGTLALAGGLSLTASAQQNPPAHGRNIPKLYTQYCASCHGAEMTGGSAPGLIANSAINDVHVTDAIRQGHAQTSAPTLGSNFNAPEIRGLVIYIREFAAKYQTAHTTYPAPKPGEAVQSQTAEYRLEPFLESGLQEPWAIAFLPDGRALITERPGRLRIVSKDGALLPDAVRNTPAVFGGEGGLLDVAVHPRYSEPGHDWVYLTYGDKSPGGLGMSAVIRGHLRDGAFVDAQQIYKADSTLYRPGGQRFGSRLLFDSKGHLYFSIGDRAAPGDEPDLSQPNGKIHRVNDDGTIPADNPFVHTPGAIPSIWSYGHRNPQGLTFNPATGQLWETEHGPRGGDELNLIERGKNYGWPNVTFGMNYDGTPITDHTTRADIASPITTWVPSIAASPLVFYAGNQFPSWKGNLLMGALAGQELRRIQLHNGQVTAQEILFKGIGRVRDLVISPDGTLYVILNSPDRILRLVTDHSPMHTSAQ